MGDSTSRLFAVLGLVLAVWVVTYWLYEPGSQRHIILDDRPIQDAPAPAPPMPEPRSLPPAPDLTKADPVPQPEPTPSPQPVPQLPPAPVAGPGEVLIPPQFDDYTVQRGETLQDIARKRYGSDSRWVAIAQSNPLLTPHKLKPGKTVIRLPRDPDNIQGKVVKVAPPTTLVPDLPATALKPAPATDGWRTYTVQDSDTLWGIAKKLYGRPSLTNLIADANADVLPDPDRLKAGITLKIPPAPPAD